MLTDLIFSDISRPIRQFLDREDMLDLCINKPGELYLDTIGGWEKHVVPELTEHWINNFIRVASNYSLQKTTQQYPLLSTTLISGERIQAVIKPCTNFTSLTIRKPSNVIFTLNDLAMQGRFNKQSEDQIQDHMKLKKAKLLVEQNRVKEFFEFAVTNKLNILISGSTGSGKTTLTKALINVIPLSERLISIEDALELEFPHDNIVRLIFSRSMSGEANISARDLLISCLRMKPDRILLSELRGGEAFDYLKNVNSGHPGSITTIHANSAREAVEQLILMVKESSAGAGLEYSDIMQLVKRLVNVVIQWDNWNLQDIYFPGLD